MSFTEILKKYKISPSEDYDGNVKLAKVILDILEELSRNEVNKDIEITRGVINCCICDSIGQIDTPELDYWGQIDISTQPGKNFHPGPVNIKWICPWCLKEARDERRIS